VGKGEVQSSLCNSLSEVASPTPLVEKVTEMLSTLNDLKFQNIDTSLKTFEEIVEILVPQFQHEASTKSLDNRL
jgi:hypothetical protein